MNTSKSISLPLETWQLLDEHLERSGLPDISGAVNDLILAGAEARKTVRGEKK